LAAFASLTGLGLEPTARIDVEIDSELHQFSKLVLSNIAGPSGSSSPLLSLPLFI
jgi:hypothetical protein